MEKPFFHAIKSERNEPVRCFTHFKIVNHDKADNTVIKFPFLQPIISADSIFVLLISVLRFGSSVESTVKDVILSCVQISNRGRIQREGKFNAWSNKIPVHFHSEIN